MMKRWMEYISVFGILLCVGLFLYNMTEMNKLSMQYNQIQDSLQQLLDDKKVNTAQNEPKILEDSSVSYYSLEKTEYLENVLTLDDFDKSKEIPIPLYWEWEWDGPTIPAEEAAQYDLVKYGYLMD